MKLWPTRINAADLVVILGEKKGIIIIILLLLSVFFFLIENISEFWNFPLSKKTKYENNQSLPLAACYSSASKNSLEEIIRDWKKIRWTNNQ